MLLSVNFYVLLVISLIAAYFDVCVCVFRVVVVFLIRVALLGLLLLVI